jgi:malonate-semialdehyde dehydrogenase (acetylating)/methylmalonate-semialdehyde dehydrogenase
MRVGNGLDPAVQVGPAVSKSQLESDLEYVKIGKDEGAKLVAGGNVLNTGEHAKGFFMEPTVFAEVTPDMRIAQEEIFGPVMVIVRAKDVDEALAVQQRSRYGNAASVFTESGGVARYVMEKASAGMVGVNVGVPVPREPFGFGGWNESKFGTGDITGRGSIEFWTRSKKMTTKWNKEAGVNWMS